MRMPPSTRPRTTRPAHPDQVAEYLLGLGANAYLEPYPYAEVYHRLHRVIRAVAQGVGDREAEVLGYGAQISQVDRVLAALFVEGALERLVSPAAHWSHVSEEVYFRVAAAHGRLIDFVSFGGHFVVPPDSAESTPRSRRRRFAAHFLALPEGHARQGMRLGILSLFDGGEDRVSTGLALSEHLRVTDPAMAALAASRIVLALERGEITGYGPGYPDLGVQIVAAAGRWAVLPALPHLRRLLESTPPRDRQARVLRANVQRAIEQLSIGQP